MVWSVSSVCPSVCLPSCARAEATDLDASNDADARNDDDDDDDDDADAKCWLVHPLRGSGKLLL